jgi:hypothetical protein
MAYYRTQDEVRFLKVLQKIEHPHIDIMQDIWRSKKCTPDEICLYLACVNEHVYGSYLSVAKETPSEHIVKNVTYLLPEIHFSGLTSKQRANMIERLQFHALVMSEYIKKDVHVFSPTSPYVQPYTYYRKGERVKKTPTKSVIRKICRLQCEDADDVKVCMKKCIPDLEKHFEIELALYKASETERRN